MNALNVLETTTGDLVTTLRSIQSRCEPIVLTNLSVPKVVQIVPHPNGLANDVVWVVFDTDITPYFD